MILSQAYLVFRCTHGLMVVGRVVTEWCRCQVMLWWYIRSPTTHPWLLALLTACNSTTKIEACDV